VKLKGEPTLWGLLVDAMISGTPLQWVQAILLIYYIKVKMGLRRSLGRDGFFLLPALQGC